MLVSKLLSGVRENLADTTKNRWTDARLLELYNNSIFDIAIRHKSFIYSINITYSVSVAPINKLIMPEGFIELKDAWFLPTTGDAIKLEIVYYKDFEDWDKTTTGNPTHLIYGIYNKNEFKVYPSNSTTTQVSRVNFSFNYSGYKFATDIGNTFEKEYSMYLLAIKYYITGFALKDNKETLSQQNSSDYINLYELELEKVARAIAYNSVKSTRTTAYRKGI